MFVRESRRCDDCNRPSDCPIDRDTRTIYGDATSEPAEPIMKVTGCVAM